jgi:hypothetical protein
MATYIDALAVARESLIVLENNMVLGNLVHRSFSPEFQSGRGGTVVVRKPTTFTATAFTTAAVDQTVTEGSVAVVLDKLWDVSFAVTAKDLTLSIVDFSEQLLQPALRAIAQAVDSDIATRMGTATSGHYPVSGTPLVSDIANLEAVLDVLKVPLAERRLVLNPVTKAGYLSLDAFLNADKRGDGGQALRGAELGRVLGFDTYMDQNMTSVTTSWISAGTAAITGAWAVAATAGTVTGATAAAVSTAPIGALFKVTGYDQWFSLNAPCTATTAGVCVLSDFKPAVLAAIANSSVVTFQGTRRNNMAFHKNAWALVTAPLAPPIGGAKSAVASYNGLSCRVVYDYTRSSKENGISVDFLCGVKQLDNNLSAILADTR